LQAEGHKLQHLDRGIPLSELEAEPVSANAYLGAWGIVEALRGGA
ncbi:MAG: acyclic terpene utilization AtuA family protein, partial [Gammaproteobacteria bacterium]|nr:acyclic terpene utilization AtuA family protein [Gammaproteobacteria bacterium]